MGNCLNHNIQWDEVTYSECPICALVTNINYSHIRDLRRCSNHARVAFYDKDYGCAACQINASLTQTSTPQEPAPNEQSLDNRIEELEDRVNDIKMARLENQIEKTGDHGRPDETGSGAGYRWL